MNYKLIYRLLEVWALLIFAWLVAAVLAAEGML